MKARIITVLAVLVASLTIVSVAAAHVTVHPNALPSGGFTVTNIQVPNERGNASTVKVDVQLPPGVIFLSTQPVTGWTAKVFSTKLAKPVTIFGETHTTQVSRVVWTARAGKIAPGQFQAFPISMLVPSVKAGTVLTFKALQTYSSGEIVRWIGAPSADEPAPQIIVSGKNSPVQDYPAGVTAAKPRISKSLLIGLPIAFLGALGVGIVRRRKS